MDVDLRRYERVVR